MLFRSDIKSFFNSYILTFICCFISFINKCLIAWLYTDLSYDKSFYFLFSKTMMQGHPPLEDTGLIMGLANYYFDGAITSPLYSLVALPFLWITKSFFYTSCILDAISWLIFFTALPRLSQLLLTDSWVINIFILTVGFFLYPHELFSNPKDTLSLGLICWACVLSSNLILKPVSIQRTFWLSFVLLAIGLTKLLFVPLPFFFISILLIFSIAHKKKFVLKHSLLVLSILIIATFLFSQYIIYLKSYYHHINIIPSPIKKTVIGFYPENLLNFFPFISSSFVDHTFWDSFLSKIFHVPFEKMANFWKILDVFLLIFTAGILFKKRTKNLLYKNIPWLVCIGTCLFILFSLCFISTILKSSEEGLTRQTFTFVNTPRFYIFIMLIIQLSGFYVIFKSNSRLFLKIILLSIFFIGSLHGLYFTVKQILQKKEVRKELRRTNPVVNIIDSYLKPVQKKEKKFLFTTPDKNLRRLAQINDIEVLFFSKKVPLPKEINVLSVALPETDSVLFKDYAALKLIKSDTIKPFILNFYTQ